MISKSNPLATLHRIRLLFKSLASAIRRFGSIIVLRLCLLATRFPEKSFSHLAKSFKLGTSCGTIVRIVDSEDRRYERIRRGIEGRRLWRERKVRRFWSGGD